MECYLIEREYNFISKTFSSLTLEFLDTYFGKQGKIIYVLDENGYYMGCIGVREYHLSLSERQIVVNTHSIYVEVSLENNVKQLFTDNESINRIPVTDGERGVIYECVRNREKFYEKLNITQGVNTTEEREERIIISLTSHGTRLERVYLTIKSLMFQTMLADEIVLYIDEENTDREIVQEDYLRNMGVTIKRGVTNLKPHTKYFYAMQEYEEDLIITVDDDVLYSDILVEELVSLHKKYPDAVVCRRAHEITYENNHVKRYDQWNQCVRVRTLGKAICATGVGGVLYPCGAYRREFLNENAIKETAFEQDDLWLKTVEVLNGIDVCTLGEVRLFPVDGTQDIGLFHTNWGQRQNDYAMEKLQKYFDINLVDYIKEK